MERLQELFDTVALLAGGRQVWKTRESAGVAIQIGGELEGARTKRGDEIGGFDDPLLLLGRERLVLILPRRENFVAGLRGARGKRR